MNSHQKFRYWSTIRFLLFLFLIGNFSSLSAQETTVEIIQAINKTKDDTTRFRLINKLANLTNQRNPDSAYLLIEEILPAAKASGHQPSILEFLYTKGRVYFIRQQYDSCLLVFQEAMVIAENIDDQVNMVHILDQIGNTYYEKKLRTLGLKHLQEALELAEEIKDNKLIFKESNNLGRMYMKEGKNDSADILINRSLDIQREEGNKRLQAEILVNLGLNAFYSKKEKNGKTYFEEAIALMSAIEDTEGLALTYLNFSYGYYTMGNFPKALENGHQGLILVENTEQYDVILLIQKHIADYYIQSEDYENALFYTQEVIKTWKKQNGNKENADLLFQQGRVLLFQKKYAKALDNFNRSFQLKKATQQFIQGDHYWNLGQCFEALAELDSAAVYFEKAKELSIGGDNHLLESQSLIALGRIKEQQGILEEALSYYQTALDKVAARGYKAMEMEAAEGLYSVNKKQGNPVEALHFLEVSRTLQDSLFNEKNIKEMARMQSRFELEQEKQQLAIEQEKENSKQRTIRLILGLAFGLTFILLIIAFLYYRVKQQANNELSKLNSALVNQKEIVEAQKEKLEALDQVKSRFFTNISHEFRTPLTVINGMLEQIEKDSANWLEKGVKLIRRNSKQLLDLINQILELRKLESGSLPLAMIQGDIIPYMRYILESFHSIAQSKGVNLHFLVDTPNKIMDYDKEKILRITSNLITNAIKFTPQGGNVYLRILKSDNLTFQVVDDGIGIPPEQMPHIFDRFYQVNSDQNQNWTTQQGEGTGIGLSLTHELVKLMDGKIEAQSKEGRGTTFTVVLPVSQNAPLEQEIDSANLTPVVTKIKAEKTDEEISPVTDAETDSDLPSLLIVEDNPDVVVYLEGLLKEHYHLLIARDGQEGIDLALENIPDLMISDVMMPQKDGFQLCEILKTDIRTSHIPIILLTAKADADSRIAGLKRGADAYLAKPFNQEELFVRLEKLLELRQHLQARYQSLEPKQTAIEEAFQQEDAFVANARSIIEQNIEDENFGIAELCKAIGISRPQLHRKIKALTNRSTSHFIRSVRLYQAKLLLKSSDLTISEVAYSVGFKYPTYFSRAFSEEFGVTPREFLNN